MLYWFRNGDSAVQEGGSRLPHCRQRTAVSNEDE